MNCCCDELPSSCQFQQRNALLHRTVGDAEEVLSIWFCKPAVSLSDVGRNRKCSSMQLVDQESVTTGEVLSVLADGIGEVD